MAKIFRDNYEALSRELETFRKNGKKIVMCSGTFDLFHVGHMRLMKAARQYGDILVAAVKSDRAAALKKEDPPVIGQEYRMETVSNCIFTDYVVMADYDVHRKVNFKFDNTSSFEWLNIFTPVVSIIKPDCFVHEDNPTITNARKQLFGEFGVESIIQPRTEGISTTEIIDKIKTRLLLQMQEEMKNKK